MKCEHTQVTIPYRVNVNHSPTPTPPREEWTLCGHYALVLWKTWRWVGYNNLGFVHINLPNATYEGV